MSRFEDPIPEDIRDVAHRLTEARAAFSPLDRDALRMRIGRSARRQGPLGRLRIKSVAGLLTAGLMLTSGAGVVIACSALGGGRHTFDNTQFRGGNDNASRCEYHGRHEEDRDFGDVHVIITFDCDHRDIHIDFPGRFHFGFNGGTNDSGNGTWNGQAPGNSSSLDVSAGGSTQRFSFNW